MQFDESDKHIINIESKKKEKKVTASTKNICKPSIHIWCGRVMEQRKAGYLHNRVIFRNPVDLKHQSTLDLDGVR